MFNWFVISIIRVCAFQATLLLNRNLEAKTTLSGNLLPGHSNSLPVSAQVAVAAASGTEIYVGSSGGKIAVTSTNVASSAVEIASAMVSTEMLPILDHPFYVHLRALCDSSRNPADANGRPTMDVVIECGATAENGFLGKIEADAATFNQFTLAKSLRVVLFPSGGPDVLNLKITGEKILQALELMSTSDSDEKYLSVSAFELVVGQRTRVKLFLSVSYEDLKLLVQKLVSIGSLKRSYCWGLLSVDGFLCHMGLRLIPWALPRVLVLDFPASQLTTQDEVNLPEDTEWLNQQILQQNKFDSVIKSVRNQLSWTIFTKRLLPIIATVSIGVCALRSRSKIKTIFNSIGNIFF